MNEMPLQLNFRMTSQNAAIDISVYEFHLYGLNIGWEVYDASFYIHRMDYIVG